MSIKQSDKKQSDKKIKASGQEFDSKLYRLSDRILYALELALKQEDLGLAKVLARALELSMTRNTGGGEFVERRDYSQEIEQAFDILQYLKQKEKEEQEKNR